ncbi:MAG: hypothetical protein HON68_04350 [Gammaproteobacteria bacterium]|jgi:hypothetical protein|nr:hypothetical protein [Gammaproteobacteria bacterium]MBT3488826.1 hypothetical protein [Gammaproteobacteria bacterium]MBT3718793.1 hypothetical protein [Gammaproteobacteria bacterium]MBT3845893.1 hypothetical protein [Gammaproteobacteria bacterium]MBT3894266.1 hypothetical protein [Gammaproteobacteria bacterium]
MSRRQTKYIHQGHYVAEVEIELEESTSDWSPTMSLDEAYKLDEVREALQQGDLEAASRHGVVYEMRRVAG